MRRSFPLVAVAAGLLVACGGGGGGASSTGDSGGTHADLPAASDAAKDATAQDDPAIPDTTAPDPGTGPDPVQDAPAAETSADVEPPDAESETATGEDTGLPDSDATGEDAPGEDAPEEDAPGDAAEAAETVEDAAPADGTQGDAGCAPVPCELMCAFGFAKDHSGCDVCECRQCATAKDCAFLAACATPSCTPAGTCACGCEALPPIDYECPGGTKVPFCACSPLGWHCLPHPEHLCPTLCRPGDEVPIPCPDGSLLPWCACGQTACVPACGGTGTFAEGWYDPCTKGKVAPGPCGGCAAYCGAIDSPAEGFYDTCTGKLLVLAACGPERACEAVGPGSCPGGWNCGSEEPVEYLCPDGAAVPFCDCGPAGWNCVQDPWAQCTVAAACAGEGGSPGGSAAGTCCPGLVEIDLSSWDGSDCAADPGGGAVCAYCGDGECSPPENACSCLADCVPALVEGAPCGSGCSGPACSCGPSKVLSCVVPGTGDKVGACTRACDPSDEPSMEPCGEGLACIPLPGHAAPGFCLDACGPDDPCPPPLTCGVPLLAGADTEVAGCFAWPPCNPLMDSGCPPGTQCRVTGAKSGCGPEGDLGVAETCDPADDACGPLLVCAPELAMCVSACKDSAACKDSGYAKCVKAPGAAYGHCAFE